MATNSSQNEDLVKGLKKMYLNKTTKAEALASASTRPSQVNYTTDTNEIIVAGVSYGKPLPVAATNTLGAVKVGTGLQMGEADHLELKQATSSEIGGVKLQGMNTTSDDDKKAYSVAYIDENVIAPLSTKAPLASPAFTGQPTAPTATRGTSSRVIATTAFVMNAMPSTSEIHALFTASGHA